MIVIDANVLIVWSAKKTPDLIRARLNHLLETAAKDKQRILIPTPALAEFLVRTNDATTEWLNELEKKSAVEVCAFDRRAAFECAFIERGARQKEATRNTAPKAPIRRSNSTVRSSPLPNHAMPGSSYRMTIPCAASPCLLDCKSAQ